LRANYEWHRAITTFTDQVNGQQTYDIPFAYDDERDGQQQCTERKLGSNHAHEYLDGACRFCGLREIK
jgi:hypothetical protein